MNEYKTCNKCKQTKKLEMFYRAKDSKDGRRGSCKPCSAEYDKSRYLANQQEFQKIGLQKYYQNRKRELERKKIHYQENREIIAEKKRLRRLKNIDRYIAQERASYERNKEQKRAYNREYIKNNLEKARVRNQRRRALLLNSKAFRVTVKELKKITNSPCCFCEANAPSDIDHIIPLSRGGNHTIGNLQPLCDNCNSTKYNKTIMEWRVYRMKIGKPLPMDAKDD